LEGWKLQFYYGTSNFCLNIPIYIGKIPKKIGILLNKLKASKKIGMFNNKMEVPNLPKYFKKYISTLSMNFFNIIFHIKIISQSFN